jgi:hypothetical protein
LWFDYVGTSSRHVVAVGTNQSSNIVAFYSIYDYRAFNPTCCKSPTKLVTSMLRLSTTAWDTLEKHIQPFGQRRANHGQSDPGIPQLRPRRSQARNFPEATFAAAAASCEESKDTTLLSRKGAGHAYYATPLFHHADWYGFRVDGPFFELAAGAAVQSMGCTESFSVSSMRRSTSSS